MSPIKSIPKYFWLMVSSLLLISMLFGCSASTPAPTTQVPAAEEVATKAPIVESTDAVTEVPTTEAPVPITQVVEQMQAPATETTSAETKYTPEIRQATQKWRIGYGNGWASDPFSAAVTKNIYDVAKEMGVEIIECDNGYDQEKTLQCADLLISQKVDGIIFANWLSDIAPAVSEKWIKAGIPAVTYDGPHPGAIDFGADNYTAGLVGGEYLGNYVQEQGWAPEDTWLVLVVDPDVGEEPNKRVSGCKDGVKKVVDIPEDQIVELIGGVDAASVFSVVTDWLTGHPNAKYVTGCSVDDPRATGMSGALESADYVGRSAIVGQGVTVEALTELRRPQEESVFIGSVAYTPEVYGNYLVPIIVDLLEKKPVPQRVVLNHFVIDRANLKEWYPEE